MIKVERGDNSEISFEIRTTLAVRITKIKGKCTNINLVFKFDRGCMQGRLECYDLN